MKFIKYIVIVSFFYSCNKKVEVNYKDSAKVENHSGAGLENPELALIGNVPSNFDSLNEKEKYIFLVAFNAISKNIGINPGLDLNSLYQIDLDFDFLRQYGLFQDTVGGMDPDIDFISANLVSPNSSVPNYMYLAQTFNSYNCFRSEQELVNVVKNMYVASINYIFNPLYYHPPEQFHFFIISHETATQPYFSMHLAQALYVETEYYLPLDPSTESLTSVNQIFRKNNCYTKRQSDLAKATNFNDSLLAKNQPCFWGASPEWE